MNLGRYEIDDLLTWVVNTHSPTTGAETDADAAPTYRVYEDETGTAILTGTMALLDDANTVGQYSEQITLSAANGFEVGKCYSIRIRAVVGGIAGVTIRTFQVEAAQATAAALVTAQADLDDIQARLPAALSSGRMVAYAEVIAVDALDAAAVKADAVTELQSGLATSGALSTAQTAITAIKDKTDLLTLAAINGEVDTAISDAALATAADLSTAQDSLDAIQAKTDDMTFTKANELDVNLQSINGTTVNGNGADIPWGP